MGLLCAAAFFGLSCGGSPPAPPAPPESADLAWDETWPGGQWNVLLVTLDTTRRDALGCYGNTEVVTATLDSLAKEGILFEHALAAVPMTLPSHATILTGLDPHEHGVRDNGHYLVSDSLVTLAERFSQHGYQTAAFLSAFPLDSRFGLDQGFDVYDDEFEELASSINIETAERKAGPTTDAVLDWIRRRQSDAPLFLWVHYFDPHEPYKPPAPFSSRPSDPYLGEVSYMDHEFGRLLRGLRETGFLDRSFVLAVGDHGESLGEHGEDTHCFFIYDATQAVPCLLTLPSDHPERQTMKGVRIPHVLRVRDLPPTLANLLGWPKTEWTGYPYMSAASLLRGGAPTIPVAYMETLTPYLEYGWSDLRAVRSTDWKYIRAPRSELYNLADDPGETANLIDEEPEIAVAMKAWLDWYVQDESEEKEPTAALDQETVERLRSLGYLQGGGTLGQATLADPKDRIETYHKVGEGRLLSAQYRTEEAIRLFESAVRQDSENAALVRLLASTYAQAQRLEEATQAYDRLLELAPTDPQALTEAAQVAMMAGDTERANALLDVLARVAPDEPVWRMRGEALEHKGDFQGAVAVYRTRLESHPEDPEALSAAARGYRELGETSRAEEYFRRAITGDSTSASAWAELADLAFESGNEDKGDRLLAQALERDPKDPLANFRHGWRLNALGNKYAAVDAYEQAVAGRPDWPEARVNLGNALLAIQDPERALSHYQVALAMGEESVSLRANQGVAFAQAGNLREAVAAWQRALELNPDPSTAAGLQRNIQQAMQRLGS